MLEFFENSLETIRFALESMDDKKFEELVSQSMDTLNNHHKIITSGLGKNVPICEKFVGTMLSLGLNANFLHTNSALHGDLGMVQKDDLVIVLTKSGETVESIYLVKELEKREANIWLFTYEKDSYLSNRVKNVLALELTHEGDLWNIVPNNSSTVNLLVLQGLAMELGKRMGVDLDCFKSNHPGGHIGEVLKNGL